MGRFAARRGEEKKLAIVFGRFSCCFFLSNLEKSSDLPPAAKALNQGLRAPAKCLFLGLPFIHSFPVMLHYVRCNLSHTRADQQRGDDDAEDNCPVLPLSSIKCLILACVWIMGQSEDEGVHPV